MFILKSLVAGLALGLAQDAIAAAAAPACCTNKCGKSVQLAKNGKNDCSAIFISTIIPTRTTTLFRTTTLTRHSTIVKQVTGTVDTTVTNTASETDYSTSTSITTLDETEIVTDVATAIETIFETTTVPYVIPATTITVVKRAAAKQTKPAYASACDNSAYSRACSCIGIKPKTVTKPAVIKTAYQTRTAYKTLTTTQTSQALAKTQTYTVSLTTFTTIISGTAITATETVTLTESATTTETTVIVATQTAAPAPPTCVGQGFSIYVRGSSSTINNWGIGYIQIIGATRTMAVRGFSGGSSKFVIGPSGGLESIYGGDIQWVIQTGALPNKIFLTTVQGQLPSYPFATSPVTCAVGEGPNYGLFCVSEGVTYKTTMCQDPTYYDWYLMVYTDVSQLAGKNCVTDGVFKAECVGV